MLAGIFVSPSFPRPWHQSFLVHGRFHMPTAPLTDTMIRATKPSEGKRVEITDARCMGLTLRVTDRGVRTFAYTYRSPTRQCMARLTIGRYPDISLAQARQLADDYRKAVANGRDPQAEKIEARTKAPVVTFDLVAEQYLEQYAKVRKASWRNDEHCLRRPVAAWRGRSIRSITDDDAAALLNTIAATAPVSANRTQATLHTLFVWAKQPPRKYVILNPLADLPRRRETPKDRELDANELRILWHGLDAPNLPTDRPIALALRFILLTMARPGMVAGATRDEMRDLDGEAPEWHLGADRMKNRKPFIVPLSGAAVEIIREAMPDPDQLAVFRSRWHARASIGRASISHALLGIVAHLGMQPFTPHDLRRTAATIARRAGASRESVEALLAHTKADVTAIYDRYDMLAEKRQAADILADAVAGIVTSRC
jgi:integrase